MPKLRKGTIIPGDEEDARINAGIAADPDTYELSDEDFKRLKPVGRPKSENPKEAVSIRFSPEVVSYFRSTGNGWQTRIDNILKDYVESHH